MKVFVTGASGWVGSHLIPELLTNGHQVIGLARSDASASILEKQGIQVQRGDLTDLDALKAGASAADAVAHCGYIHDFKNPKADPRGVDLAAITAFGQVLKGTGKPFVITSATAVGAGVNPFTETTPLNPAKAAYNPRVAAELLLDSLEGVHGITVRLPPSVHGDNDRAFVPVLIDIAKAKGVSGYVEEGSNLWPAVHVKDAARAFRLALEKAPAGTKVHAVGDEGIPFKQIAEFFGKKLGVPTKSIPKDQASEHFSWLGMFVQFDNPTTADDTKKLLGWEPKEVGLMQDLEEGHYFDEGASGKY